MTRLKLLLINAAIVLFVTMAIVGFLYLLWWCRREYTFLVATFGGTALFIGGCILYNNLQFFNFKRWAKG